MLLFSNRAWNIYGVSRERKAALVANRQRAKGTHYRGSKCRNVTFLFPCFACVYMRFRHLNWNCAAYNAHVSFESFGLIGWWKPTRFNWVKCICDLIPLFSKSFGTSNDYLLLEDLRNWIDGIHYCFLWNWLLPIVKNRNERLLKKR